MASLTEIRRDPVAIVPPAQQAVQESESDRYKVIRTILYVAQTAFALIAALAQNKDFSYVTVPFAALSSLALYHQIRSRSEDRVPGFVDYTQFSGFGTSIAAAAVNTGSAAFKLLSAVTASELVGHLGMRLIEKYCGE